MKQLKSSLEDLTQIYTAAITVRHIAEPLASFDADYSPGKALRFMERKGYDVVGVRERGLVAGYARRDDLGQGDLGAHLVAFESDQLLDQTSPLLDAIAILSEQPRAFIRILGPVAGIVTPGDLQKIPLRMWLYGLISLIEMQLLRIIRELHVGDSWHTVISPARLGKAKDICEDRIRENRAIDLVDCLELCDKYTIVLRTEDLADRLGFSSKRQAESWFSRLGDLRDDLAHAQDLGYRGPGHLLELASKAETVLEQAELIHGVTSTREQ